MANYLFYPTTDKTQDGIWVYGCDEWGEKQAEKYIRGLHAHLQEIADKQIFCLKLPDRLVIPTDLTMSAYFSKYGVHYVFFRELSAGNIGVMSILHERSDIPVHLKKDIVRIRDKEL